MPHAEIECPCLKAVPTRICLENSFSVVRVIISSCCNYKSNSFVQLCHHGKSEMKGDSNFSSQFQ